MAANNFFNVVNISGGSLTTTIDGETINVPTNGAQSPAHKFPTGEKISVTINSEKVDLNLPQGVNSWSTLVYTTQGINVFPSSPCQEIL